jgi:ribonuclease HI
LEFDCTNNITEYEELLLGLELARDMKIKMLRVIGDSDLVVMQIEDHFVAKNDKLKRYKQNMCFLLRGHKFKSKGG